MTHQYTVIGQPIAHSLSPEVHQIFAQQNDKSIIYTRTESSPDTFEQTLDQLQSDGFKGCNVTAPFKEQAFKACHQLSNNARLAGSVNTIEFLDDGDRRGSNTDGPGLVFDLKHNHQKNLQSSRVLILGAGGATRGVIAPLLGMQPGFVYIANRTSSKSESLAAHFSHLGPVKGGGYSSLTAQTPFDIIINATSLSLMGDMPAVPASVVVAETLAYDMTYASEDTVFMQWAQQLGAITRNGLGMLVEQAAESFLIWEGVRPDTRTVYPTLLPVIEQRNKR